MPNDKKLTCRHCVNGPERLFLNLVPRVSLLCLHSTTMEEEKRDPGNEVGPFFPREKEI